MLGHSVVVVQRMPQCSPENDAGSVKRVKILSSEVSTVKPALKTTCT